MKAFSVIILGATLLVSVLESCQGDTKGYAEPESCKRYECRQYEVSHSEKDYEIRSYDLAYWAATSPFINDSILGATLNGNKALAKYINGENDQKVKLNQTFPILVDVVPSKTTKKSSYTVQLYLTQKYQRNPPKSPAVHPTMSFGHHYAAVRRFEGPLLSNNVPSQVAALKNSLKGGPWGTRNVIGHAPYSVALYSGLFDSVTHVNEVILWFDYGN